MPRFVTSHTPPMLGVRLYQQQDVEEVLGALIEATGFGACEWQDGKLMAVQISAPHRLLESKVLSQWLTGSRPRLPPSFAIRGGIDAYKFGEAQLLGRDATRLVKRVPELSIRLASLGMHARTVLLAEIYKALALDDAPRLLVLHSSPNWRGYRIALGVGFFLPSCLSFDVSLDDVQERHAAEGSWWQVIGRAPDLFRVGRRLRGVGVARSTTDLSWPSAFLPRMLQAYASTPGIHLSSDGTKLQLDGSLLWLLTFGSLSRVLAEWFDQSVMTWLDSQLRDIMSGIEAGQPEIDLSPLMERILSVGPERGKRRLDFTPEGVRMGVLASIYRLIQSGGQRLPFYFYFYNEWHSDYAALVYPIADLGEIASEEERLQAVFGPLQPGESWRLIYDDQCY